MSEPEAASRCAAVLGAGPSTSLLRLCLERHSACRAARRETAVLDTAGSDQPVWRGPVSRLYGMVVLNSGDTLYCFTVPGGYVL
jgi:hypothetical protein